MIHTKLNREVLVGKFVLATCQGTGAIVCSDVLMILGSVSSPTSSHVTRLARTPRRWVKVAAVVVSVRGETYYICMFLKEGP